MTVQPQPFLIAMQVKFQVPACPAPQPPRAEHDLPVPVPASATLSPLTVWEHVKDKVGALCSFLPLFPQLLALRLARSRTKQMFAEGKRRWVTLDLDAAQASYACCSHQA